MVCRFEAMRTRHVVAWAAIAVTPVSSSSRALSTHSVDCASVIIADEHIISTLADRVNSIFAIDVDADGDVDVLSATTADDTVAWYENDGAQSFAERVVTNAAAGAYYASAIDIDGDGDVDVFYTAAKDDTIARLPASYRDRRRRAKSLRSVGVVRERRVRVLCRSPHQHPLRKRVQRLRLANRRRPLLVTTTRPFGQPTKQLL